TVDKLSNATDSEIFKLWEGLGYYNRCRNLIETARYISKELKGNFPDSYEKIKSLKGIGPYTAAAISSFAFDLPYAVVDGNVFRVLARVFGINKPTDSTNGKAFFSELANELLDKKRSAVYNQAIMDFGALICKAASPLCTACVFNKKCIAYLDCKVNELPVKEKRISIRKRFFYYLVMEYKNRTVIRQRSEKDIWQQLYEFPLVEVDGLVGQNKILQQFEKKEWLHKKNYEIIAVSALLKQKLSHQLIYGQFIRVRLRQKPSLQKNWQWIFKKKLSSFPFPQLINQYLQY
ncbi:MAG: A/G-specific adenine glycosylase, partial [Bacteroidia bacterium]|nr:A/G-specific adenine glycosylase [Bacteroidia bacterium]